MIISDTLLVFDIGNTHIVIGVFDNDSLVANWRLQSDVNRTVDEYAMDILWLLDRSSQAADVEATENTKQRFRVKQLAICCVVPPLTRVFVKLAQKYFSCESINIDFTKIPNMPVNTDDPKSVGADRLVNAYAARENFGYPCIVVDMGTATTFDIVGLTGAYEGGVIAPGLSISAQALFSKAAMLPTLQIEYPKILVGKNTKDAMLSGIVHGYTEMVNGLVYRISKELAFDSVHVIGTGGLISLIAKDLNCKCHIAPDLTLRGIKMIVSNIHSS